MIKINNLFTKDLGASEKATTIHSNTMYSLIDYLKYDHPSISDFSKKEIELSIVNNFLDLDFKFSSNEKLKSLDIGCATCRYPFFFKTKGFMATGYDTNENIVNIYSKKMAEEGIKISNKNILNSESEFSTYDIITCMMGTFNHVKDNERELFTKWVFNSLKPNGVFICTIWNPLFPQNNFLSFYQKQQRELLRKNLITDYKIIDLFKCNNFNLLSKHFFCTIPDQCFINWFTYSDKENIIATDKYLTSVVNPRSNSQMVLLFFQKTV